MQRMWSAGSSDEGGSSRRVASRKEGMGGSRRSSEELPLPESQYITGFPLLCLIIGLMLAVFLISIDRTIISTVCCGGEGE